MEIENLTEYYAQRAAKDKQAQCRTALSASMGGFRTLADIESALDWLANRFPHQVSQKFSIGTSIEGRELWAIRLSDIPNQYEADEPTVWFDALHHAREAMSAEALLRFAYDLAAQYSVDADIGIIFQLYWNIVIKTWQIFETCQVCRITDLFSLYNPSTSNT